jgi:hypothetical protein
MRGEDHDRSLTEKKREGSDPYWPGPPEKILYNFLVAFTPA